MKQPFHIQLSLIILCIGFMACKTNDNIPTNPMNKEKSDSSLADSTGSRLKIKIGSKTFTAMLLDNATASAFKARLPITIAMSELNGNEKLYNFSENLPAHAANPETIQTGDLMIYGSRTLVLFYKTFSTPYSYTRLGRINDTAGLAAAVGTGNVTVTFELE